MRSMNKDSKVHEFERVEDSMDFERIAEEGDEELEFERVEDSVEL